MKKLLLPFFVVVSLVGIIVWQLVWSDAANYYIVSVALLVLSMLPFLLSFEGGKKSAGEITLVATMIALAVVSRGVFYLIPQVKPIAAVVIVAGVCLGAERGYIVGAFSAFISNFIFGQGYWTPFQMVALGLVGLLAGLLFKTGRVERWSLGLFGFLSAFLLYGAIVDMSTVLMTCGNNPTLASVLAVYGAGVPFSLVFGITTAVFLWLFGMPFVSKIQRVITKYDIIKNKDSR